MADFRPKPYHNTGEIQTATATGCWSSQHVTKANDLRSYSAHYSSNYSTGLPPPKLKKDKSSMSTSSRSWSFNDAEFQRKKRVASYKVYSVEGKVKGSFRRSLRWIKDRYAQVLYGWW